jgi:HlyD family secretion protein
MPRKNYTEEELKNVNLRSEEFKEVLGRPPRWTVKWGITVVFLILLVLLLGSWFFKYPDVVPSQIVVTTENPPAPIVARATGKIEHLMVHDRERVDKGQPLVIIENTGYYKDILDLEAKLDHMPGFSSPEEWPVSGLQNNYKLGALQEKFSLFLKRLEDYRHFLRLNYHQRKIASLKEELERSREHHQKLQNQKAILVQEHQLALRQYKRDSMLFERDVIPEAKYEESETRVLRKQYSLEQVEVSLSNARIQQSRIEQSILELELDYRQKKNQLLNGLQEAKNNLKASIDQWKRRYYMESPIEGKVTFTRYWSENQHVEKGRRVMTVIPASPGEIIGKMTLPLRGAGKVEEGQEVHIRFVNYPHLEYGMVKGIIRSISLVPENQVYTVEVDLPNGLTTFYGKKLEFSQQMEGQAEIVTRDTRLLERIVRPLRYMVNKNLTD